VVVGNIEILVLYLSKGHRTRNIVGTCFSVKNSAKIHTYVIFGAEQLSNMSALTMSPPLAALVL
jgi:hypothetical protein